MAMSLKASLGPSDKATVADNGISYWDFPAAPASSASSKIALYQRLLSSSTSIDSRGGEKVAVGGKTCEDNDGENPRKACSSSTVGIPTI